MIKVLCSIAKLLVFKESSGCQDSTMQCSETGPLLYCTLTPWSYSSTYSAQSPTRDFKFLAQTPVP